MRFSPWRRAIVYFLAAFSALTPLLTDWDVPVPADVRWVRWVVYAALILLASRLAVAVADARRAARVARLAEGRIVIAGAEERLTLVRTMISERGATDNFDLATIGASGLTAAQRDACRYSAGIVLLEPRDALIDNVLRQVRGVTGRVPMPVVVAVDSDAPLQARVGVHFVRWSDAAHVVDRAPSLMLRLAQSQKQEQGKARLAAIVALVVAGLSTGGVLMRHIQPQFERKAAYERSLTPERINAALLLSPSASDGADAEDALKGVFDRIRTEVMNFHPDASDVSTMVYTHESGGGLLPVLDGLPGSYPLLDNSVGGCAWNNGFYVGWSGVGFATQRMAARSMSGDPVGTFDAAHAVLRYGDRRCAFQPIGNFTGVSQLLCGAVKAAGVTLCVQAAIRPLMIDDSVLLGDLAIEFAALRQINFDALRRKHGERGTGRQKQNLRK